MQFVVPQFIEVESKIIGPISARQFIILLAVVGLDVVFYKLFPPTVFIPLIFLFTAFGGALAFGKVNSQPMHYFLLNVIQTLRRPRLRIWARTELSERHKKERKEKEIKVLPVVEKPEVTESRLAAISLMVDTGGAYANENEEIKQKNETPLVSALPSSKKNTTS